MGAKTLLEVSPDNLSDDELILQTKALLLSNIVNPNDTKTDRLNELRPELFKRFTDDELKLKFADVKR